MAGRPKRRARLVAQLAELAADLSERVQALAPPRYRSAGHVPAEDEVGLAWVSAIHGIIDAEWSMAILAELLADKAGLPAAALYGDGDHGANSRACACAVEPEAEPAPCDLQADGAPEPEPRRQPQRPPG
jgi:hypothetical protein